MLRWIKNIVYFIYIKKHGEFSNEWYLKNNPDVEQIYKDSFWHKLEISGIPVISQIGKFMTDPLFHYIKHGCFENRNPTIDFNATVYCAKNPDVNVYLINPFYHYLKYGVSEGRDLLPVYYVNSGNLENYKFIKDAVALTHKLLGFKPYQMQPEDMAEINFNSKKIAVHLHLYYVELSDEMIAYLNNIPVNFDLFITVIDKDCDVIAKQFKQNIPLLDSIKVKNVPNRGRDIAPFLLAFGNELLEYDYCCHIHTKKSPNNPLGDVWRSYLLTNLLGSVKQVTGILNLLSKDAKFVFPESYFPSSNVTNWYENFSLARKFFASKNISLDNYHFVEYGQGTMFWCRSICLQRLLELDLKWEDFPAEPIGTNGTLAHVLERSFLFMADNIEGYAYCLSKEDIKISILCNIWNTPKLYLLQMLDSVMNQTYLNWEFLINNCSDAEHAYVDEILQKYVSDPRVKIFRTENRGIANNSNFIFSKASGDFVFLMDHDDILLPEALKRLAAFQKIENSDFVYADEFFLEMRNMRLHECRKRSFSMKSLEYVNYINHPALIRRELLRKAGGFRDGFEGSQDHDLYLRVCEKTDKIAYVPDTLYVWRINEGSFSERHLDVCINSGIKAVQEHLDRMGLHDRKVVSEGNTTRYKIIVNKK